MSRRLSRAALLAAFVAGAAACGLPTEVVELAASSQARIEREAGVIETKAADLERFASDSDNDFLQPYIAREAWADRFAEARSELQHARQLHVDQIVPLLEADEPDDEPALREQIARLKQSLDRVAQLGREPAQRAAFLRDARDRAPELAAQGQETVASAATAIAALATEVERAATDYGEKREDLAGRLAAARKLEADARESQQAVERESGALSAGRTADLAVLADSAARVAELGVAQRAADAALRGKIAELYRSYSKTLLDMKDVNTVEIGRTSWNESYDFPRETEARFPVEVSEETLAVLEGWGDRPVARLSSYFGRRSLKISIDRAVWDSLGIDPLTRMPRGDNSAEFWVGESSSKYYHRYAIVEGGESQQTEWAEVDEETYEESYDDLGMDIFSKPYGVYEEDALTEAAPPGMAYVGNPKYGRWENDNQGRRHWSWGNNFLFYYLMFGGRGRHYYYHNDWNHWNSGYRGRRPYYGRNSAAATYGTYGSRTRNSSRFASSGFARGGGFRRADRSVRGAGPRGRGGGPGRSGK